MKQKVLILLILATTILLFATSTARETKPQPPEPETSITKASFLESPPSPSFAKAYGDTSVLLQSDFEDGMGGSDWQEWVSTDWTESPQGRWQKSTFNAANLGARRATTPGGAARISRLVRVMSPVATDLITTTPWSGSIRWPTRRWTATSGSRRTSTWTPRRRPTISSSNTGARTAG